MHDIIGDIIDWDEAHKVYLVMRAPRFPTISGWTQRSAQIEARWQHLPGGFHCQRKQMKIHLEAVADTASSMSQRGTVWLAIAAASIGLATQLRYRLSQLPDLGLAGLTLVIRAIKTASVCLAPLAR